MIKIRLICIFIILFSILSSNILTSEKILQDNDVNYIKTNELKPPAKWTVMYYMCGDSSKMNKYIDPLLENLSNICSDENLNIVALSDKLNYGNSKLYYFNETGVKIELNQIFGWPDEVNMGDFNTLELFCIQMMKSFPANYYALVIFAAGGTGWQQYVIGDKDSNKAVSIPDFANSLNKIVIKTGHKIDVLFGSCAINMIETAYEFAPYINYIVGTQDCFPDKHVVPMFYKAVADLKNDTSISPEEFACRSPANYHPIAFYYAEGYGKKISLICKFFNKLPFPALHSVIHYSNIGVINNSEITKLTEDLNDLASLLLLNINNHDILSDIIKTRKEVQELGKCTPIFPSLSQLFIKFPFEFLAFDCYVDLYDLINLTKKNIDNQVIKNKCDIVLKQINKTIPEVSKIENISCCGMNIYFPKNSFLYNKYIFKGKIPCPYEELKFSKDTNWDEFLRTYLTLI